MTANLVVDRSPASSRGNWTPETTFGVGGKTARFPRATMRGYAYVDPKTFAQIWTPSSARVPIVSAADRARQLARASVPAPRGKVTTGTASRTRFSSVDSLKT